MLENITPPWTIAALKQIREQGLKFKDIFVGHGPVPVVKAMGSGAENLVSMLYFFEGDSPDHKEFFGLCKDAGFEPWKFSEAGIRYRAYRRVQDALTRAGSLDKEKVREAMWKTDLPLFGEERMKIDGKGYGTDHPYPVQFHGDKYVSLWPLDKGVKIHRYKDGKW
jgi:ABC-type branched-subunit amino acid transport system substrate-binding protein